jgi:hypothetical protein
MDFFAHSPSFRGRQSSEMGFKYLSRSLDGLIEFGLFLCHKSYRIAASGLNLDKIYIAGSSALSTAKHF